MQTISDTEPPAYLAVISDDHHVRLTPERTAVPDRARHLSLGSQDLVRFAAYAASCGWTLKLLDLAGPQLDPIPAEDQARISAEMLSLLDEYGVAELDAAMTEEFDHLYVSGVHAVHAQTGTTLRLRRRGLVVTTGVPEAEAIICDAWRELRLS